MKLLNYWDATVNYAEASKNPYPFGSLIEGQK